MSTIQMSGAPVLKWRNRNILGVLDISGTNIYRSTSPMDINNMPEPYDTVTGTQEYYADTNVEYDITYYYRIGVFNAKEEKLTDIEVSITPGEDFVTPDNVTGTYISPIFFSPTNVRGASLSSIKTMDPTEDE